NADHVAYLLRQAAAGPYPAAALAAWQTLFELRLRLEPVAEPSLPETPPVLTAWLRGQQARLAGHNDEAATAYPEALAFPSARPFARYGLACLGLDDFAAILEGRPGSFLVVRCRVRLALDCFRRREGTAAELLRALKLAEQHGFSPAEGEHFRALALAL